MCTTLCIPLISNPSSVSPVCEKKLSKPVMKKPMIPISV